MSQGLLTPPFRFSFSVDSNTGAPQQTVSGVNFTAGGSNADGTAVSVIPAIAQDIHYLVIAVGGILAASANAQALMDVLVDPAGGTSWVSLIDDLPIGFSPTITNANSFPMSYYFPLWVKSGSSLGVRARTANATDITSGQVAIYAFGGPTRPDMWWCGQKVETLGAFPTTSLGTPISSGAAGTYGSFTTIGVSAGRWGALQMGLCGTDATAASVGYFFQVGLNSAKIPGTPNWNTVVTTGEQMSRACNMPVWCDVPAGSTLQVAGTTNAGAGEAVGVTLHGVVA